MDLKKIKDNALYWGIASLVLSLSIPIVGLITSIVGGKYEKQLKAAGEDYAPLNKIALIVSIIMLSLIVLFVLFWVIFVVLMGVASFNY